MKKLFSILLLCCSVALAQNRPTPVDNLLFNTDVNGNYKNITNMNSIVFYKNGTNLTVDLLTFLNMLNGEAKKLVDPNSVTNYLFISNSVPYLMKNGILEQVTINSDNTFIRQNGNYGYLTNVVVYNELKIEYPSTIDDSDYAVTWPSITNGAINKLRIGRFMLLETPIGLISSNTVSGGTSLIQGL